MHLGGHFTELFEALLELLAGGRVFGASCDQLNRVQSGLLIQIIQQLNDLVKFVQVVDLNFSLLELG